MRPNIDVRNQETMVDNRNWKFWCRLCAEENMKNSFNIFLKHEQSSSSSTHPAGNSSDETPGTVAIEIIKFFLVNLTFDDDLPQSICNRCNTLIESIVDFSDRVSKVQKMFSMLQNSFDAENTDMDEVRLKCGITYIDNMKNTAVPEVILVEEKPKIQSESEIQEHESLVEDNPLSSKIDAQIKCEEVSEDENMEYEHKMSIDDDDDDTDDDNDEDFKPNDPIQTDVDDDGVASDTSSSATSLTLKIKDFVRKSRELKVKKKSVNHECCICPRKFRNSNHFEYHMKHVHQQEVQVEEEKKIAQCEFCDKKFKTKGQLESHINNIHKSERPFVCKECGYTARTKGTLKTHVLTHSDYAPFTCDLCSKSFKTEYQMKRHKTNHDLKELVCGACGLQLNSRSSLNRHLVTHYTDKDKEANKKKKRDLIYTCEICNSIFRHSNHFESHMKRIHQQDVQIDEDKKIAQCTFCEKKFKNKWLLESHVNSVHKNERPYICEECGFTARISSTLKQHMLTHTDYAPFECDVCKKCFKAEFHLRRHKEIHDPNKYVCQECGLQLNSRTTLNRHLLIHSDKMDHKCDYCGREFKRAKTLKNHLLLHIGLKPYACDFCDRTFANGSNCRTHKKKSHPVELAAQEASGEKSYTQNIPKLSALKAITKNKDNLTPVVSKQSGNFAFGKKPKPKEEKISTHLEDQSQSSAALSHAQQPSNAFIPSMDNFYQLTKQAIAMNQSTTVASSNMSMASPNSQSVIEATSTLEQKVSPHVFYT